MAVATGAALRLRLLFRMLRVGELLALAVLLSWSSSRAPSAAVRVPGSLLFSPSFVFVLGNAIVLLLLALSKRQDSSISSSGTGASSQIPTPMAAPPAAYFPSFTAPVAAANETPAAAAKDPVVVATVFEGEEAATKPAAAPVVASNNGKARPAEAEQVGEDGPRGVAGDDDDDAGDATAVGFGQRAAAAARDVVGADGRSWGMEDADGGGVIGKQTRFHLEEEESMSVVPSAVVRRDIALATGAGALVVLE